jgi:hypothetical protein
MKELTEEQSEKLKIMTGDVFYKFIEIFKFKDGENGKECLLTFLNGLAKMNVTIICSLLTNVNGESKDSVYKFYLELCDTYKDLIDSHDSIKKKGH